MFEIFLKVYFKLLKRHGEDWRQKLSFVNSSQIGCIWPKKSTLCGGLLPLSLKDEGVQVQSTPDFIPLHQLCCLKDVENWSAEETVDDAGWLSA